MQWQNRKMNPFKVAIFLFVSFLFFSPLFNGFAGSVLNDSILTTPPVQVETPTPTPSKMFRTPARLLDDRFTVKVQLKQGDDKYIVPFWVDRNVNTSIIDDRQMREMGWKGKIREWDEFSVSGHKLDIKKLKNGDAEEAYQPDFFKSCCYGIIGNDILSHFDIVAYDYKPAYLEWTPIEGSSAPKKSTWKEKEQVDPWELLKKPIFPFYFKPPARKAYLLKAWNGIPAGAELDTVQEKYAQYMDKFMLENYLRGKMDQKIVMEFILPLKKGQKEDENKKVVITHEFKMKVAPK